MRQAVAADLMPRVANLPGGFGEINQEFARHEKGALDAVFIQNRKNFVRRRIDIGAVEGNGHHGLIGFNLLHRLLVLVRHGQIKLPIGELFIAVPNRQVVPAQMAFIDLDLEGQLRIAVTIRFRGPNAPGIVAQLHIIDAGRAAGALHRHGQPPVSAQIGHIVDVGELEGRQLFGGQRCAGQQ